MTAPLANRPARAPDRVRRIVPLTVPGLNPERTTPQTTPSKREPVTAPEKVAA